MDKFDREVQARRHLKAVVADLVVEIATLNLRLDEEVIRCRKALLASTLTGET